MKKIYEVRDCTDPEIYYSLGLFESLGQAITEMNYIAVISGAISPYADDYEHIKVFEITLGWDAYKPKEVYSIKREWVYDSEIDGYDWMAIKV